MNLTESLLADIFFALGHPNRLRIIDALREGEICQCVLPDRLHLEQSNLSRHLKQLSKSGVIRSRKDGTRILLSISDPVIYELIDEIRLLLQTRLNLQLARLENDFDAPLQILEDSRQ